MIYNNRRGGGFIDKKLIFKVKKMTNHNPKSPYYYRPEDLPNEKDTLEMYVRRRCKEKEMSLEELARNAKFNRGTLYNLFESSNPRISHLLQLAQALGVHHYYLMRLKWREFDEIAPIDVAKKDNAKRLDASGYVDETVPDGSLFAPQAVFEKSWTIQNIGDTVWENRFFIHLDAPYHQMALMDGKYPDGLSLSDYQLQPHQTIIALPVIEPGQLHTLSVFYTAPNVAGRYISYWRMVDDEGKFCFSRGLGLSVSILVRSFGVGVD